MPKYKIVATAFKRSGKMDTTGETVDLGHALSYPADRARAKISEIYEDLDKYCGLPQGAVKTNGFTVLIQVLDDTSNPIVYQELVV